MESRDGGRVLRLIEKLRRITLAVQVLPFAYTSLYIAALSLYLFADEGVLTALDTLFYVSPVVVLAFYWESRILELCKWHRAACLLPLIPLAEVLVDLFLWEFPIWVVYLHGFVIVLMSALLLVAAYKVFLSPKGDGRERRTDRDF